MKQRAMAIVAALSAIILLSETAAYANDPVCKVGRTRIVGGSRALLRNWPGHAALRLHSDAGQVSDYFCGGTAISQRWVITAAHCLHDFVEGLSKETVNSKNEFHEGVLQVVLGAADLERVGPENVYAVERVAIHPNYRAAIDAAMAIDDEQDRELALGAIAPKTGDDIALVRLARPWRGPVGRLSLDAAGDPDFAGNIQVHVAGFGRTTKLATNQTFKPHKLRRGRGEFYAGATRLLETAIETMPSDVCRQQHPGGRIGRGQFCAGIEQGDTDSCAGDSGGPIVQRDERGCPHQIGLVSWGGHKCADANAFGVYTRLSHYARWIRSTSGLRLEPAAAYEPVRNDRLTNEQVDAAINQLRELLGAQSARVSIAIEDSRKRVIGPKIRLGKDVVFRASSSVAGRLVILDINADREVAMIYPNRYVAETDVGLIKANRTIRVPGPGYPGFTNFEAVEPLGRSRLLALVVPEDFDIGRNVAPRPVITKGFAPRNKPASFLMRFIRQIQIVFGFRSRTAGNSREKEIKRWGFQVLEYEITR